MVQEFVSAIGSAPTAAVAAKDVYDAVLQFFSNVRKVHLVAASSRALDLQLVTVVLVEALETLDEEEVDSEPCG